MADSWFEGSDPSVPAWEWRKDRDNGTGVSSACSPRNGSKLTSLTVGQHTPLIRTKLPSHPVVSFLGATSIPSGRRFNRGKDLPRSLPNPAACKCYVRSGLPLPCCRLRHAQSWLAPYPAWIIPSPLKLPVRHVSISRHWAFGPLTMMGSRMSSLAKRSAYVRSCI